MKRIMYSDCNNNINFIKDILRKMKIISSVDLVFAISDMEMLSVDMGDSYDGKLDPRIQKVYDFQEKIKDEHKVFLNYIEVMDLLNNVRTIYYGVFETVNSSEYSKVKIFDGDIVELYGEISEYFDEV